MSDREDISTRFHFNLERVASFVNFYESTVSGGRGRKAIVMADELRVAVVLLHATLEDLLRSLAEWKLPTAPAASLERIPLAGSSRPKDKFTLVDLAEFRGQTVDAVIENSVEDFLERSSYNHPGEVAELLAKIEINVPIDAGLKNDLAAMMTRRHWIAHRVDRNPLEGPGNHRVRSIALAEVKRWIKTVEGFGQEVLDAI